jgi:hypothetical protein
MNVQDDTLSIGTRVTIKALKIAENVYQLQRNIHRSKFDTEQKLLARKRERIDVETILSP